MQKSLVAITLVFATLPLPSPSIGAQVSAAPPGTRSTRYCLRVEPITGSRIKTIQCLTRSDWGDLDVDVDQEWAENGGRVIN